MQIIIKETPNSLQRFPRSSVSDLLSDSSCLIDTEDGVRRSPEPNL